MKDIQKGMNKNNNTIITNNKYDINKKKDKCIICNNKII